MVYNSDGVIVLKDRQTKLSTLTKKENGMAISDCK